MLIILTLTFIQVIVLYLSSLDGKSEQAVSMPFKSDSVDYNSNKFMLLNLNGNLNDDGGLFCMSSATERTCCSMILTHGCHFPRW